MTKKVALVVGGGSGIGADAARKLAEDGFTVGVMSSSGKGEALGVAARRIWFHGLCAESRQTSKRSSNWPWTSTAASMPLLTTRVTAQKATSWKSPTRTGTSAWIIT